MSIVLTMSFLIPSILIGQGHTLFDSSILEGKDFMMALQTAREINRKKSLTAKDMLQIYYAEITIGRCVWGLSPRETDPKLIQELKMFSHLHDSAIGAQCVSYVQSHKYRFLVIDDGFKGEENFWEPDSFWLKKINAQYPHSTEAREISFDLEFANLIRRFHFFLEAQGKSCSEYWAEELTNNRNVYLEVYGEEELKGWVSECEQVRKSFEATRAAILKKYNFAPFTKKLQEIDLTMVVNFHSVE